jgi:DNA invertase Pin-like site-specific DNA recombinase
MKTAVIYARVSDRKQAEEDVSVPSQVDAARAKAEELGATVLRVFTAVVGTAKPRAPASMPRWTWP